MKPVKPFLLKIAFISLLPLFLARCADSSGSWKNEKIKSGMRDMFHGFNTEALIQLKANKPKMLNALLSKEMIDDKYTTRLVEKISNHLNDDKFELLDEYYAVNKYLDADTIVSNGPVLNNYILKYPGVSREMYMAFFVPKASQNQYMVSLVYAKLDYGWKITNMDVHRYTVNGKTAPELYRLAQQNLKNNYLVDALNNSASATLCIKPNEIWEYPIQQELHEFYNNVVYQANQKYHFPLILGQTSTKPAIFRITTQNDNDGSYPMIYYLSHIKLSDTEALKKENNEVKKAIGQIMPGIDKDKKFVYYAAYNKLPNNATSVDRVEMVDKLK